MVKPTNRTTSVSLPQHNYYYRPFISTCQAVNVGLETRGSSQCASRRSDLRLVLSVLLPRYTLAHFHRYASDCWQICNVFVGVLRFILLKRNQQCRRFGTIEV
ncbi:hypothetical protein Trydic_g20340 [Trypoxylus dichotomus]